MVDLEQTIVAEATPQGHAPLRVVRLSGGDAFDLARRIFRPEGATAPWHRPRTMVLGEVFDREGRTVDRALVVCFAAPASLTGEDVVDIQLHGGPGVVRGVLEVLIGAGARPALPGEFSYRAVLNGKMDLLQAEAVDALISAETSAQARTLAPGVGGGLSRELGSIRDKLVTARAAWEARVDFPEDVAGPSREEDFVRLESLIGRLSEAALNADRIRCLKEGLSLALVGPVNSGKSSLFNALLKRERALVTPHPGTTRDTVEESIQIGGFPVVLIDTAGIRDTAEPVERMGVERSVEAAGRADGTVMVYDGTRGWGADEDAVLAALPKAPVVVLANKCDLPGHDGAPGRRLATSAVSGRGLDSLVGLLAAWVEEKAPQGAVAMASERQAACVKRALEGCLEARRAFEAGFTEEIALQGLRIAQEAMEDLLGGGSPEELYDRIFSRFCIGK